MAEGNDIKRLVIVESTTKAKKIAPYLGSNYIVEASVGHIRGGLLMCRRNIRRSHGRDSG